MLNEVSQPSPHANDSRAAWLAARVRALPHSAWFLLAANLVPLLGVLAFGWDLGTVMALFWAENAVIGVFMILRIAVVAGWGAFFLVPFFALHYGVFTLVHGAFVLLLFVGDADATLRAVVPGIGALLLSHGVSFVVNFLLGSERPVTRGMSTASDLMVAPYRRVVVMHLTIIGGGFLILLLGAPVYALLLLVALKTGIDLRAHLRERAKHAS